jgi:hypothetical protein
MLVARPVAASHSSSAPSIRTSPVAGSKRTGIPVRSRRRISSASTPITESCGPVMPTSESAAVPPGWIRASFVCTCVCVPSTAVARPSSQRAIATFSLVASAWTSTMTTCACRFASSTSSSTSSHGECATSRKSVPIRLSTATGVPSTAGATASPLPGAPRAKFAGRITRSAPAR